MSIHISSQDTISVRRFIHQYFQLEQSLDYPAARLLRSEQVQESLYQALFESSQRMPPIRYQLGVLKKLLKSMEDAIQDWEEEGISDNLMNHLADLLAQPLPSETTAAQQKSYVTYHLSLLSRQHPAGIGPEISASDLGITTLESRALISGYGTTGLRTWEAALHLGQFLCTNSSIVKGKRVLELGCGTGYVSILCAKHLGASQVIASDGSDDVLMHLSDNFYLNELQNSTTVSPMDLKWGHALVGTEDSQWNGGQPIDVVLGADITYDQRLVVPLVSTLKELMKVSPSAVVYIAATQRNAATFEAFLDRCHEEGFRTDYEDFPTPSSDEQTGPFYSDRSPILICRIATVP